MLSIRFDPHIERRLSELAKCTGRTKSYYARELIEGNIEDLEDRYFAEARLQKSRPPLSSQQVRKELGLGDRIRSSHREGAHHKSGQWRVNVVGRLPIWTTSVSDRRSALRERYYNLRCSV